MKKYKNRYGGEFTFTELNNGNILWEGNFEHCRFGIPNDYTEAYTEYLKNEHHDHTLSFEEFKEEVHEQDELVENYGRLVKPNTEVIDMVDPSGGPYISSGMDLERFGFPGKKVKEFKNVEDGWEIVVSL